MQTNQEWQASDSKVSPVAIPSLTDALTVETAGSTEWTTKDLEQEAMNRTSSDTHVTLDEACNSQSYSDE